MNDFFILTWDCKEQINFSALNNALAQVDNPKIYLVDSGGDSYAVIVANSKVTQEEAQELFNLATY